MILLKRHLILPNHLGVRGPLLRLMSHNGMSSSSTQAQLVHSSLNVEPSILENKSLEEMKQVFSQLPEALSLLALARTADGTRARYSRLYRTLAMKVPSLRDLVTELEKGGVLKDVRS